MSGPTRTWCATARPAFWSRARTGGRFRRRCERRYGSGLRAMPRCPGAAVRSRAGAIPPPRRATGCWPCWTPKAKWIRGMMPEGPRLYYLDDIPTPYRLGLQEVVADLWPGTFRLRFCSVSVPGCEWQLDFGAVDVEFLPGRQFSRPTPANPFQIKWNPGVAKSLAAWKPDVVILSGYTHATMWRAARGCIRNGLPYGVSCETSHPASARLSA